MSPNIKEYSDGQYTKVPTAREKTAQNIINRFLTDPTEQPETSIEGIIVECTSRVQKELSTYINDQLPVFIQKALEQPMKDYITSLQESIISNILNEVKNSVRVDVYPITIKEAANSFTVNQPSITYSTDVIFLVVNGAVNREDENYTVVVENDTIVKMGLLNQEELLTPDDNVILLVYKNMKGD